MQKTIELPRIRHGSGLPHAMKIDAPTGRVGQVEVVNETAPQYIRGSVSPLVETCPACGSNAFAVYGAQNRRRCHSCHHVWGRV